MVELVAKTPVNPSGMNPTSTVFSPPTKAEAGKVYFATLSFKSAENVSPLILILTFPAKSGTVMTISSSLPIQTVSISIRISEVNAG